MLFFISDGRVGNQVFQYVYLNTRARDGEMVLCVNMGEFEKYFDCNNKYFIFIARSKLSIMLYKKIVSKIFYFLVKLKIIGYIEQIKINGIAFPDVRERNGILPFTYVQTGFFQSEKLFKDEKVDFKLKNQYKVRAKKIFQKLPSNEKVFIHVRRGDYVSENYLGERGIDLPKQYFVDAITIIEKNVKDPFYIFLTDDPGFVRCCFSEIENKFVSEEDLATDLAIMSLCDYGVISNSSFSWWGAYLSTEKKVMIFPKYWYGWKKRKESHPYIQPSWGTVIDVVKQ